MKGFSSIPRSLWLAPLVLAIAGTLAVLIIASKSQPPARPVAERTWNVNASPARFQRAAPQVSLYGHVESPRTATLTAATTAFVAQQAIDEGDQVAAGELLLTLDPRDADLAIASRRAQRDEIQAQLAALAVRHQSNQEALKIEQELLQLAQRAVTRIEQLKGRQVSSETQLDEARRSYQQQALSLNNRRRDIADYPSRRAQLQALLASAEAQLASAELDLQRTEIRAPFNGRVTRIQTTPGSRVRVGDPLLTLYQSDTLEIRAQLPSRLLPQIRQALAANTPLLADADLDGTPIELQLDRMAGEVGSGRAGVDALFRVGAGAESLVVGRTLALRLTLPPRERVLSLPAQALYGTNQLYLINDHRLHAVEVERLGEHWVEGQPRLLLHSDTIKDDDLILITQLPNAMTGLRVRVAD